MGSGYTQRCSLWGYREAGENGQNPGSSSPPISCQKLGCPHPTPASLCCYSLPRVPCAPAPPPPPHALREVVQAVFSHASLLYNPHLLILWDSTQSLLMLVCIMIQLLKKKKKQSGLTLPAGVFCCTGLECHASSYHTQSRAWYPGSSH